MLLILATLSESFLCILGTCSLKYLTSTAFSPDLRQVPGDLSYIPFQRILSGMNWVLRNSDYFRSFTVTNITAFTSNSGLEDVYLICPVRALSIIPTLRVPISSSVVFFRKRHTEIIHPHTNSSWLNYVCNCVMNYQAIPYCPE